MIDQIANLLGKAGELLLGIAAVITAVKHKPKKPMK